MTMQHPKNHAVRLRRAKRFRRHTLLALLMALGVLGFLLASMAIKGWNGFTEAQLQLTIPLNTTEAATTPFAALKSAWVARFGEQDSSRRALEAVFSRGAEDHLKTALASPQKPTTITLWLPASQAVKRFLKNPSDSGLADLLTATQLDALRQLQQAGDLRLRPSASFWQNPEGRAPESAGIAGALLGSLMTILVTMAAALPLGLMAALYLEELAPRRHPLLRWWWHGVEVVTMNLAATPSVVFGLLGLALFLNLMQLPRSAPLVGGLVLALMALPLIIIAARSAIRAVPTELRDAATALGASPMQVTLHHVLPAAFPGMITGAVLALAHVLGETAPLMLIGMVAFITSYPTSWLQPATTLPIQIYLWATSPEPAFANKAAAAAVVLLILVLSINALAQKARRRWRQKW
jgi:phosphate transport system permease protein